MPTSGWFRGAATTVLALGLAAGSLSSAFAAPTPSAPRATAAPSCGDSKITFLNFNDFHGRLAASGPDTVGFFGDVEKLRGAAGGADKTILYANGDSVGGSLFSSAAQNDDPTLDVLDAAGLDGHSLGNHEFDKGADDFSNRISKRATFPYQGANVVDDAGKPIAEAYHIFDKNGLKVAVVGAVTGDLPSLVSPDGLKGWKVTDPVDAVNAQVSALKDGNPDNGEADVVVAQYHEGSPGSVDRTDHKTAPASSPAFDRIVNQTDSRVAAIFNAHTHQTYSYEAPVPGMTGVRRPVVQAGSYASDIAKVELGFDPTTRQVTCYSDSLVKSTMTSAEAVQNHPRAAAIKPILDQALAKAAEIGGATVGEASDVIARPANGERNAESAMSSMVAQMFKEQLGKDDPNFIGMQNPGGTRADFDKGPITFGEAAAILPFANSLMTTEITGDQLKKVLEQQWQRDSSGKVPSRPYLQLSLSKNATYTYDASRPEGDRITSITVSGKPVDAKATYTVGSGSFLIAGGDNFFELGKGRNPRDTGRADLQTFTEWVEQTKNLSPDYARRAVSAKGVTGEGYGKPLGLTIDKPATVSLGTPQKEADSKAPLAPDTLDMTANKVAGPKPPNTEAVATIGGTEVGRAAVTEGRSELQVTARQGVPTGAQQLTITINPSKTVITVPVTVAGAPAPNPHPELGNPTSEKKCDLIRGGCVQNFEKGSVYSSPRTGEHVILGAIGEKWAALGRERGALGYPTSNEFCNLRDGGCAQRFEGGLIYWSPRTGANQVWGAIGDEYARTQWERGGLGYPTGPERCGLAGNGCAQAFQYGTIQFSPATGAHAVWGAIGEKYAQMGAERSPLGHPTGGEYCGLRDGGCGQRFSGGTIYWSPRSGAHPVWGAIGDFWAQNRWENGRFGYPVFDEQCAPVPGAQECRQSYSGGVIVWNSRTGVRG